MASAFAPWSPDEPEQFVVVLRCPESVVRRPELAVDPVAFAVPSAAFPLLPIHFPFRFYKREQSISWGLSRVKLNLKNALKFYCIPISLTSFIIICVLLSSCSCCRFHSHFLSRFRCLFSSCLSLVLRPNLRVFNFPASTAIDVRVCRQYCVCIVYFLALAM